MSEYAVMPKTDYLDACDAVREMTGSTAKVKSGEMGTKIRSISTNSDLPALSNPAGASHILNGYEAINGAGVKVTGSILSKAAQTYTPGTADQTIAAGQYLSGAQTIKGDANLEPANIAKDVIIFGVKGEHEGGGSVNTCTVVLKTNDSKLGNSNWLCACTQYIDGEFVANGDNWSVFATLNPYSNPITLNDVVCGSVIALVPLYDLSDPIMSTSGVSTNGSTVTSPAGEARFLVLVTNTPNVTDTITLSVVWD